MSTLSLFDRTGMPEGEASTERVFRVAEVNRAVRETLEGDWADVWIEGELSDVQKAASGHVYFTLNDGKEQAQVRGVMFRGDATRSKARLEDGACVRVRGTLSLYEPRGSFQVIVRLAIPAGPGALAAEFERIRKKLEAEGLLDPARKRRLPMLPRTIGVVTSAQGAALADVVRVAGERCPVRIVVADCRVQGADAVASIVAAIEAIQKLPGLDVVIVARGGGAAEDLWAFNDERVARAIVTCRVPVVSGVGHEVDVTIADLIADVRAATPSNAAEIVVPDRDALMQQIDARRRHLERTLDTIVGRARLRLEKGQRHLSDPRRALSGVRGKLAAFHHALERVASRKVTAGRASLSEHLHRLSRLDPRRKLAADRHRLVDLRERLTHGIRPSLASGRVAMAELAGKIDALSPLAVLARGYAVAFDGNTGKALLTTSGLSTNDSVRVRLAEGQFEAAVTNVTPPRQTAPVPLEKKKKR